MPDDPTDAPDLPAGDFSAWLTGMRAAIRGDAASDVPCGTCTACCTSSQFVHVGPDEIDTLAHIPRAVLFPAPGLPAGHVLMGYDERGHCPMLIDDACSIYDHRPRTCRTYDCRVFAAAGVELDDADKQGIALRARRWRFRYASPTDHLQHDAVRAAARSLRDDLEHRPSDRASISATQLAVRAVDVAHTTGPGSDER